MRPNNGGHLLKWSCVRLSSAYIYVHVCKPQIDNVVTKSMHFAPSKVGVLAKCVPEGFEQFSLKFQSFLQRGCASINPSLSN